MNSLFINENDEFIVEFVVGFDKNGLLWCDLNEDSLRKIFDNKDEELKITEYKAVFRKPAFGDTISLNAFSASADGLNFNPVENRFKKIDLLIKKWNLESEDGKMTKPTEGAIKKLHPIIAAVIGAQVDLVTGEMLS